MNYDKTATGPLTRKCNVDISPPQPSVVKNVSVVSYHFTSTGIHPHALVVIMELSLAWLAPTNPNAQLEDLRYQVWLGPEVTTQPETSDIMLLEDVHQEGNGVRIVRLNRLCKIVYVCKYCLFAAIHSFPL